MNYFVRRLRFQETLRVDGWVFLSLQSFNVLLGHCPNEVPAGDTNNHSYFAYVNCEGVDDLIEEYKKQEVEFAQEVSDKPWGRREFEVRTPEGHRIVFGEEINQSESSQ